MKIQMLFFAAAREAVGHETEEIEVASRASVQQVLEVLGRRHPRLAPLRDSLRIAVNEDFVGSDHLLEEGDRMALLPPVSGG